MCKALQDLVQPNSCFSLPLLCDSSHTHLFSVLCVCQVFSQFSLEGSVSASTWNPPSLGSLLCQRLLVPREATSDHSTEVINPSAFSHILPFLHDTSPTLKLCSCVLTRSISLCFTHPSLSTVPGI